MPDRDPGEVPPRRLLERAPSERYGASRPAVAGGGSRGPRHQLGPVRGVLGPFDFLDHVYGLLVPLQIAAAAAGALAGTR